MNGTPERAGSDGICHRHPEEVTLMIDVVDEHWFLATCLNCEPPLPQPFRDEAACEAWAKEHGTIGHEVVLSDVWR